MEIFEKIVNKFSFKSNAAKKTLNDFVQDTKVLENSELQKVEGGRSSKTLIRLGNYDAPLSVLQYQ